MNSSFFEAVFCLNQMSMEIVGRGIWTHGEPSIGKKIAYIIRA